MLEAVTADLVFTISLKRRTQNLLAVHKNAGRLPHLLPRKRKCLRLFFCGESARSTNSEFPLDRGEAPKAGYGMQAMDYGLRVTAGPLS